MMDDEKDLRDALSIGNDDEEADANTDDAAKAEDKAGGEDGAAAAKTGDDAEADKEGVDADAAPDLPELTDEQIAALAKDPRVQEAFKAEAPSALDELVNSLLAEKEGEKTRAAVEAETQKTVEEALKAFEEGDPAPLADLAAKSYREAQSRAALRGQLEEAVNAEVGAAIDAAYGDLLRTMKPDEVKALDAMSLPDALKELQKRAVEVATGQSREDSQKALAAAKTGAAARADGSVNLPGGASAKDDVGDDIGALMRKGLADSLDMEE